MSGSSTVTIVTKTRTREIPVPESYTDLLSSLSPSTVSVKYKTNTGALKLIESDTDLQQALHSSNIHFIVSSDEEIQSFPSTPDESSEEEMWELQCEESVNREILPVHERVTCDGCLTTPVRGIRYKCAVCPNFDYCEKCWQGNEHLHAFYAIRNPYDASHAEIITMDARSFPSVWKATAKVLKPKKLKLEYLREGLLSESSTVYPGNQVRKTWYVRNSGTRPWPAGCVLTCVSGKLQVDSALLPALRPGEEREIGIHFEVSKETGLFSYAFRAMESDGSRFGERLHMTIRVEQA